MEMEIEIEMGAAMGVGRTYVVYRAPCRPHDAGADGKGCEESGIGKRAGTSGHADRPEAGP